MVGAVAVGAYTAADVLNRHADSEVIQETARVATNVYGFSADCAGSMLTNNVAFKAGEMVAKQIRKVVANPASSEEPCPDHAVTAPPDPQPLPPTGSEEKHGGRAPSMICQGLELIKIEPREAKGAEEPQGEPPACPVGHEVLDPVPPPPICEDKHEELDPPQCPAIEKCPQCPAVCPPPACKEENADVPAVMPHVEDAVDVPAVMPLVDDGVQPA
jgi:hypothetical protein